MSDNTCSLSLENPHNSVTISDSDKVRFWSKVDRSGDCWLWQSSRMPNGYGRFHLGARESHPCYAHRTAWELTHGPIPKGLSVLHHCDVRACCKPSHLFLGTQADNMQDAARKGRLHVRRPKRQVVSDAQVAEMIALRQAGLTLVAIAARYNVSKAFVSLVARGLRRQYDPARKVA